MHAGMHHIWLRVGFFGHCFIPICSWHDDLVIQIGRWQKHGHSTKRNLTVSLLVCGFCASSAVKSVALSERAAGKDTEAMICAYYDADRWQSHNGVDDLFVRGVPQLVHEQFHSPRDRQLPQITIMLTNPQKYHWNTCGSHHTHDCTNLITNSIALADKESVQ